FARIPRPALVAIAHDETGDEEQVVEGVKLGNGEREFVAAATGRDGDGAVASESGDGLVLALRVVGAVGIVDPRAVRGEGELGAGAPALGRVEEVVDGDFERVALCE